MSYSYPTRTTPVLTRINGRERADVVTKDLSQRRYSQLNGAALDSKNSSMNVPFVRFDARPQSIIPTASPARTFPTSFLFSALINFSSVVSNPT